MFMLDADDGKSLLLLMLIMSHHLMRMLNVGYNNIGLTVISLLLVLMLIPVVMLMLKPDLPKYVDYGDVEVAGQEEIPSRRRQKLLN